MNPVSFIQKPFLDERDRWFLWFPVALGIGITAYFLLPQEPHPFYLAVTPVLALCLYVARKWMGVKPLLAGLLAIALGFNAAQLETRLIETPLLHQKLEPVSITGTLMRAEALPEGARLTLKHVSIKDMDKAERPKFVRVKVRTPFADLPEAGVRVNVWGPLWPPSPPVAPGDYDFRRNAFFNQIGATGMSYGELREREAKYPVRFFWDGFYLLFEQARRALTLMALERLDGPPEAMTVALLSGSQTAIDKETMQDMRASGLSHLLSISGVHVSMMAFLVFLPLRFMFALVPALALRWPIKKIAALAAIVATAFYTLLVGADAPTVRSALMTSIVLFAIIIDRKAMSLRLVALAAIIIMLVMPHVILGPSFQMSFAAVLAMIAAYEKRIDDTLKEGFALDLPAWLRGSGRHLRDIVMTSLIATAATTPFTLFHFQTYSFYGVIANMVAIPLTTLWIMPCLLLTYIAAPLSAGGIFTDGAGWGVSLLIKIAHEVASWPLAQLYGPPMPMAALALLVGGGLWLCLWHRNWRYLGLLPIAAGCFYPMTVTTPSVFIAESDPVWAVRLNDGRMASFGKRAEDFTIHQWRQRTGNPELLAFTKRKLPEIESDQLTCDEEYCAYDQAGHTVLFLHAEASTQTVAKACARQDFIVVAFFPLPDCKAGHVIDAAQLAAQGSHAISFEAGGQVKIATAREKDDHRPWFGGYPLGMPIPAP